MCFLYDPSKLHPTAKLTEGETDGRADSTIFTLQLLHTGNVKDNILEIIKLFESGFKKY
jgi:hypothetical protein